MPKVPNMKPRLIFDDEPLADDSAVADQLARLVRWNVFSKAQSRALRPLLQTPCLFTLAMRTDRGTARCVVTDSNGARRQFDVTSSARVVHK